MTEPGLLDLLLAEPGLAVCGGLVLIFAFVAWRKLLEAARESRRETNAWWASRQQYKRHYND